MQFTDLVGCGCLKGVVANSAGSVKRPSVANELTAVVFIEVRIVGWEQSCGNAKQGGTFVAVEGAKQGGSVGVLSNHVGQCLELLVLSAVFIA